MGKIIIDTDPGVDDALAISLACFANLPVVGLTTVFGNSTIENCTRNALTILELLEKNIQVYEGASEPIKGNATLAQSHGDNGLGGFLVPKLKTQKSTKDAVDFLINEIEKNPDKTLTIFVLGPATNIALLSQKRPDLIKQINKLIILAGVIGEKGNMTPYAEFNALNDPYALKTVLDLSCQKVLLPINICRKVFFSSDDFDQINDSEIRLIFKKITDLYIQYYTSNKKFAQFQGGVMYDLLIVSYFMQKNLFSEEYAYIEVEVENKERLAETCLKVTKKANCVLVTDVNAKGVKNLFFETINSSTQQ
jgi:inosine-uridine nucleoside N-ribohydrolase